MTGSDTPNLPKDGTHIVALWEGLAYTGDRDVMAFGGPQVVRERLASLVTTPKDKTTIDVWLQSPGGSAHEAYRYMLLFREYAARVRVVVGEYAKSAATLMLLGADDVYMGATSDLGPLDAQIYVDEDDKWVSALDIARSVEHLAETALDLALSAGGAVHVVTGIPRKSVLPALLTFTTDFVNPIVAKLDPKAIHRATSQLDVAREYGKRLLAMRADPCAEADAERITYHLVNDYPDHGFIISRDEARSVGLPVRQLDGYEYTDLFRTLGPVLEEAGLLTLPLDRPMLEGLLEDDAKDADTESDEESISSAPPSGADVVAMPEKKDDPVNEEEDRAQDAQE